MPAPVGSPQVLVVDDEPDNVALFQRILRSHYRVHTAGSGAEAIACIDSAPELDVVVTDQRMPGLTGVDVLRHARLRVPNAARIIVTAFTDFNDVLRAVNEGQVNRVLSKPVQPEVLIANVDECVMLSVLRRERDELLERVRQQNVMLEDNARRMRELATSRMVQVRDVERQREVRDSLTDLFNHRYFQERWRAEVGRAKRHKHALSLMLVLVSNLAEINEGFGFSAGDRLIAKIGDLLRTGFLRSSDVAARYDGARLAIILPETANEGAQKMAERLHQSAQSLRIHNDDGTEVPAPILSIGISTAGADGDDANGLVRAARDRCQ